MMQGVYQKNGRLMEGTGYNPSETIVSRGSGYPSGMVVVGRPDTVFPIIKGENWGVTGPNISMCKFHP